MRGKRYQVVRYINGERDAEFFRSPAKRRRVAERECADLQRASDWWGLSLRSSLRVTYVVIDGGDQ